jgi:RNA recognition motif-containing protein
LNLLIRIKLCYGIYLIKTEKFIGPKKVLLVLGRRTDTHRDDRSIKEISVIKDKATGKMKGFAFVTFADYDNVDKAVCKYFNVNCRKTKALDIFFGKKDVMLEYQTMSDTPWEMQLI